QVRFRPDCLLLPARYGKIFGKTDSEREPQGRTRNETSAQIDLFTQPRRRDQTARLEQGHDWLRGEGREAGHGLPVVFRARGGRHRREPDDLQERSGRRLFPAARLAWGGYKRPEGRTQGRGYRARHLGLNGGQETGAGEEGAPLLRRESQ